MVDFSLTIERRDLARRNDGRGADAKRDEELLGRRKEEEKRREGEPSIHVDDGPPPLVDAERREEEREAVKALAPGSRQTGGNVVAPVEEKYKQDERYANGICGARRRGGRRRRK